MTCPQCNTDLPESATFCYKCGSPIRPVAFSYLPAGSPPWPTSVSSVPSAHAETEYQNRVQEEQPVAEKITPKPKHSTKQLAGIIAVLILVPVIGIGATLGILWTGGQFSHVQTSVSNVAIPTVQPNTNATTPGTGSTPGAASTPAPGTTPSAQAGVLPTPTSFHTSKNTQMGISIEYPSDWSVDPLQTTSNGNTSLSIHPPQQEGIPVAFSIGKISSANSTHVSGTDLVNQANLQGFGSNAGWNNMQAVSGAPQHVTIGGVRWDEQDADFTDSNGYLYRVSSISVKHDQTYFNILFFAPGSIYSEAMQKYYSKMLTTFQFLS
jgi:hypothetical protein